jgi:hypothetical protein
MLGKLVLAGVVAWLVTPRRNTPKTRNVEDRLNSAMPRIPWPQQYDGPAGNASYGASNSSYGPSNTSYGSGNYSYPIGGGGMGSSRAWTDNQGSGVTEPWSHAHVMTHTHDFGTLPTDFNNLRNSYSDTVVALNALRQSHSDLVPCVGALRQSHSDMIDAYNTLRADHSNLLNNHNSLMFRLNAANILQ